MADPNFTPFSYLTAPNALLYRHVMGTFVQAKRRFTVHMRPEDVHGALRETRFDLDAITDALSRLVDWGNLRADPDTSRVTTVEDFHRARYLYQVTRHGEAVEQAVATYDETLGKRGALQAVALTDIATSLRALAAFAGEADPDPAKVHLTLRSLVDRFTDLAGNAQAFMGSLQRTIDLHDADIDTFLAYKDRLIEYLERFIKDLIATGSDIAVLVAELEPEVDALLDIAARREAEDAAPGGETDGDDPRQREFERGQVLWNERWQGFSGWFVSEPGRPSQAKLLRSRARAAIPQLLQVVSTLNERRAGRSDRSADFRALARWFAQAPDEAAMHRLWRATFGLSSSRHLTVDETMLDNPVSATTSWEQAPSLEISPRLRKTGSFERRGKPNRVVDRSEQRRYLAELASRQSAEAAAARRALVTTHPTRLSDVGELDPNAFRLFLGLLGDALSARVPGESTVETTTTDGTLAIRLTALDGGGRAEIHTPDGVFRGPDHLLEIEDLTAVDTAERSA
ncbi:MAG: TIGR02677 family protein [Actinophytocola sp.]|nr:TIGR02677 family protein [Actinophytocola sp.]